MKKVRNIILAVLLTNVVVTAVNAIEESVLSSEFTSYEKALGNLSTAASNNANGIIKDEQIVRFVLSVYGDFMGFEEIKQTWLHLKMTEKRGPLEAELEEWLIKWDKKTVLTLLAIYPNLDQKDQDAAALFVNKLVPDWGSVDLLKTDKTMMQLSEQWSKQTLKKGNVQSNAFGVKKVMFTKDLNSVEVNMPEFLTITVVDRRMIKVSTGKMSEVDGGVFDGIPDAAKKSDLWMSAAAVGKGFGTQSIIWKDDNNMGGIQILKGDQNEAGQEVYFLFYKGNNPPGPSSFLDGLNAKDVELFITRGKSAVRSSLRKDKRKYETGETICRYSSYVSISALIELLEKNQLTEKQLMLFTLCNSESITAELFSDYPALKEIVSKYK